MIKIKQQKETFYSIFAYGSELLQKLKSGSANTVALWMFARAEENTGWVHLSPALRREMMSELDLKTNTISNNLRYLKDANIISGEDGSFMINPLAAWKGDLEIREKILKNKKFQEAFHFMIAKDNEGEE